MRKKINIEYVFSSSVKILFSRLSTTTGLSEWFADRVEEQNGDYIFYWGNVMHRAQLLEMRNNTEVKFRWEDAPSEEEFFGFRINVHPITEDVSLFITDFVEEQEEEDVIELWNSQIEDLRQNIGG